MQSKYRDGMRLRQSKGEVKMPKLAPKLTVNVGGMFASKSTALIAQGKRHMLAGHKVVFIKPESDNRYSEDEIVTHDGQRVKAINIKVGVQSMIPVVFDADVILIDEVQFFEMQDVYDIKGLLSMGKVIYASGLDMDYKGEPFQVTMYLMGIAHEVIKYQAVCSDCGADAYVTAKTSGSNNRVELGSKDIYKPVCLTCYSKYQK
jgi:thymidine kinase